ncbi:hypothetical protein AB0M46_29700 [Dactylosporangium sp. NPDC051485]|uniref:hypothetical protein n=1 Tax=Dactylosporangium sp. NPDC051485 TaxID=3154846 RepID=UPI00343C2F35
MSHPWTNPGPEEPPPLRPEVPDVPQGVAYDPAQSYVVYQAAPGAGFGPPPPYDPMVSPDYAGWWRRSTQIFKAGWKPLVLVQLVGLVAGLAVAIPEAIWAYGALNDFITDFNANQRSGTIDMSGMWSGMLRALGLALLAIMVQAVVAVAVNHVVVSVAAGVPVRLGAALGLAGRRFLPLIGWQFLAGLIIGVGICACLLPALYFWAVFMILPAVVAFERGGSAISRCFQLFHRDFGSSLARVATIAGIAILSGVVAYVIGTIVEVASGSATQPTTVGDDGAPVFATVSISVAVARQVLTLLFSTATRTFTDVLVVTAYADMRGRYEPLDTATLAREAGVR